MLKTNFKYLLITAVFLSIFTVPRALVWAQTQATESANTQEKIDLIKEKVASRVAELTKAITVGVEGSIKKIEEGLLTLDINGKQKTVNTDKDTVVSERNSDLSIDKLEFDDLEEKDEIVVIGEEQIGTDIINAKLITTSSPVIAFTGEVKEVDTKKFTFVLMEADLEYTFDFEKYTDSLKLVDSEFKEIGFTEIKKDMKIQLLAAPQKNSETRFTALRLIVL